MNICVIFPFFLDLTGIRTQSMFDCSLQANFLRGHLIPIILYTKILFIFQYRPTLIMYNVPCAIRPSPVGRRPPVDDHRSHPDIPDSLMTGEVWCQVHFPLCILPYTSLAHSCATSFMCSAVRASDVWL